MQGREHAEMDEANDPRQFRYPEVDDSQGRNIVTEYPRPLRPALFHYDGHNESVSSITPSFGAAYLAETPGQSRAASPSFSGQGTPLDYLPTPRNQYSGFDSSTNLVCIDLHKKKQIACSVVTLANIYVKNSTRATSA